ncbi:N-6 DNA methylase, partial [Streptomyces olivaceoviridis]
MQDNATEVTAAGIARLAGVGRAAVSNWRRRHADFPKPVGGTETSPSFALAEVEAWLRKQGKLAEVPLRERVWQQLAGHPEGPLPALVRTGCVLLLIHERPTVWLDASAGSDARLAAILSGALDQVLIPRLGGPAGPAGRAGRGARGAGVEPGPGGAGVKAPADAGGVNAGDGAGGVNAGGDAEGVNEAAHAGAVNAEALTEGVNPGARAGRVNPALTTPAVNTAPTPSPVNAPPTIHTAQPVHAAPATSTPRATSTPQATSQAPPALRTPTGPQLLLSAPLLRGAAELAAEMGARQAFEFLLGRHLDANPRQYTLTPAELAGLMADLAGPARTVLDPACGTGALLRAVATRPDQELYAQDSAPELAAISALRLALHSRATVRAAAGDTLRADAYPGLRADVVLCHPPFNERNWGHDELAYDPRWEYGFPARTESDLAWVQHALARLTDGGTAVLLMPPAAASRRSGEVGGLVLGEAQGAGDGVQHGVGDAGRAALFE